MQFEKNPGLLHPEVVHSGTFSQKTGLKNFKMDVIETFKGDATLRQISEAVRIERTNKRELINRKKEYRPTVSC